jgi:hypothetical protein
VADAPRRYLTGFVTTLAEDEALMASPDGAGLGEDERLCVQMRVCQKRILARALQRLG